MLREIVVVALMLGGAFFMLLAGIGIQRMPDLFTRMSSTSKAGTLGTGLLLLAAAIHFGNFAISVRSLAIILFMMLTAPVAAHMIGRAAYFDGVPLWKGTVRDDLRSHYRLSTHSLDSASVSVPEQDRLPDASEIEKSQPDLDR